jgi:BirA family biotin operon repressor/biotin-[acetyl-CoA-carboxylase] ligase
VSDVSRPPIDVNRLQSICPGRRVEVVETIPSTNAALLADGAAPAGAVLVAEEQTAGRGRLERSWTSPARAGLLFSVLLRPSPPVATWGWLPLLAGVALSEAVTEVSGVDVGLKWPNDLVVRATDEKLAGVLTQAVSDRVVIGIGLNVSTTREELPLPTATSLLLKARTAPDRTALLAAILARLDAWLAGWEREGGEARAVGLADAYAAASATVGREVTAALITGETLRGRAVGVDADGRLRISVGAIEQAIGAGDVAHVRASER